MKRLLAIFTGKHQPDRDALSALLDGALAPERASALEAHVANCEACTATLDGMREVRAMLHALPEVEAPRSFKLRPADVAAPRRTVPAPPSTLMRAMPVLSGAAVIIFAIAVSFDVAGGGSDSNRSAPLAAMSDSAAESPQYNEASRGDEGAAYDSAAPTTSPAPGALQRSPDATPPVPAAGAAPESTEDATTTAAFEARAGQDGDAAPPRDENERDVEATSAVTQDDGDGNNLALRIVEIASAAVAVGAAVVGIRLWRKRGEAPA